MRGFSAAASVHNGGRYIAFDQGKCIEDIKKYEYCSLSSGLSAGGSQMAITARESALDA